MGPYHAHSCVELTRQNLVSGSMFFTTAGRHIHANKGEYGRTKKEENKYEVLHTGTCATTHDQTTAQGTFMRNDKIRAI